MQTGIFYVKLNEKLLADVKEGKAPTKYDWAKPLIEPIEKNEVFRKDKTYPVLGVQTIQKVNEREMVETFSQGNVHINIPKFKGWETLFLIPMENNLMLWIPSDLFVFTKVSGDTAE